MCVLWSAGLVDNGWIGASIPAVTPHWGGRKIHSFYLLGSLADDENGALAQAGARFWGFGTLRHLGFLCSWVHTFPTLPHTFPTLPLFCARGCPGASKSPLVAPWCPKKGPRCDQASKIEARVSKKAPCGGPRGLFFNGPWHKGVRIYQNDPQLADI